MKNLTKADAEVWTRIENYKFDQPVAIRTFARRLAEEHGWTIQFASSVIEEYRRFAFLAVVAGHPVSPSEVVDEVWHQHLIYTQSYWNDFCSNVLRQPLHHFPANGSSADNAKYEDWYSRTLDSYELYFGPPPREFWPTVEERKRQQVRTRHVDAGKYWIIPKPVLGNRIRWVAAILLVGVLLGCAGNAMEAPFDLRGPEFLMLFGSLLVGLAGALLATSIVIRTRGTNDEPSSDLTVEELGYLAGGAHRLVGMAVHRLCRQQLLAVDTTTDTLFRLDPHSTSNDPLDMAVLKLVDEQVPLKRMVREIDQQTIGIRQRLINLGLLVTDSANHWSRVILAGLTVIVLLAGMVKIGIGVERNRPVGFLVLLLIPTLVLLKIALQRAHRTFLGDTVLKAEEKTHKTLKSPDKDGGLGASDLALAFALFGPPILYGTDLESLRKLLVPQPVSSGGCSTSSCGGSGCGSGCGGGCGGCGGGGD